MKKLTSWEKYTHNLEQLLRLTTIENKDVLDKTRKDYMKFLDDLSKKPNAYNLFKIVENKEFAAFLKSHNIDIVQMTARDRLNIYGRSFVTDMVYAAGQVVYGAANIATGTIGTVLGGLTLSKDITIGSLKRMGGGFEGMLNGTISLVSTPIDLVYTPVKSAYLKANHKNLSEVVILAGRNSDKEPAPNQAELDAKEAEKAANKLKKEAMAKAEAAAKAKKAEAVVKAKAKATSRDTAQKLSPEQLKNVTLDSKKFTDLVNRTPLPQQVPANSNSVNRPTPVEVIRPREISKIETTTTRIITYADREVEKSKESSTTTNITR